LVIFAPLKRLIVPVFPVFSMLPGEILLLPSGALIRLDGRGTTLRFVAIGAAWAPSSFSAEHFLKRYFSMKSRYALALFLGMTCSLIAASDAKAQCGPNGGYGFDVGRLYRVMADNVPHFAAFPPVYYSAPVPRTYGYSPFAYPPGTMTPEVVNAAAPVEIVNPHYKPAATSTDEVEDKLTQSDASQPLLVINPYVSPRLASVHSER
jgi:hypothetical protein